MNNLMNESAMTQGQGSQKIIDLIYGAATNGDLYLELVESLKGQIDGQESINTVNSLLAHLKESSELSQQFFENQNKQVLYHTLADQLPFPIILLDKHSQVILANERALKILNIHSNKQLPTKFNLGTRKQKQQVKTQLTTLVQYTQSDIQTLLLDIPSNRHSGETVSLLAMLSPICEVQSMYADGTPRTAVAALFISQQPNVAIQHEPLESLYELTSTEAFIAGKLANAYSTEKIAQMRNSSVAIIQNHIDTILQKTQTTKQQELVSLLLRAPIEFKPAMAAKSQWVARDHLLELEDKRLLSFRVYGDTHQTPLVLCHASLSCRLEAPIHMQALLDQGYYLIVPERAGFGLSSMPVYGTLLDFTDDMACLLDHLKIESSYFLGSLAGGCYAMAMAYAYPKRVKELMLIESFSPFVEPSKIKGAPFFYRHFPPFCHAWPRMALYTMRLSMFEFKRKPDKSYRHLLGLFNDVDSRYLALDKIQSRVKWQAIESVRQGVEAVLHDIILTTQEWGFDICKVTCPCHIFYGEGDPVAAEFSKTLQQYLPNNTAHFYKDEGFASMLFLNLPALINTLNWDKTNQASQSQPALDTLEV
jgi:pimeloyl-ACP methyl ester carboxylesterase/DNA-binding CsgD family transcriptional regulator